MSIGRRLIVVSNRGPVGYGRDEDGRRVVRRGGGGLVTALRPLVSRHDVTWVASAMSDEERAIAASGPIEETATDGSRYRLRLVAHDPGTYELFYNVAANPALWFVQHGLWELKRDPDADLTLPWNTGYRAVNENFAHAVVAELERDPEAAVLFQDYHLYLAPRLVRERVPDALLGHFVHIPWVGPGAWRVLPEEIVRAIHDGLLANDVLGFHTERWRDAFLESATAYLGPDAARRTLVSASPISVDPAEFEELAWDETVLERERELLVARPELLVLRVDRTDPAKNAVRGFHSFGRLLERRSDLHGRVGMLALLDPSRQEIPEYAGYRNALEATALSVNERFALPGWTPIDLRIRDDLPSSIAAYKQFDVLMANSVMDGLNLVVKEAPLVNERDGVVVLSHDAGAIDELRAWVVPVDPHDVEQQADALEQALELPLPQRRAWLAAIRAHVRAHDVDEWVTGQLAALERASTMRS